MEKEQKKEINIMDILLLLKKFWVIILIVTIIFAAGSFAYTKTMMVPMYGSSAQVLIKALTPEAQTVYSDSTSRLMLVNNCIEVLSGTEVMQQVVDELELPLSAEQLQSCITISSPADTQVLKISVIHPDPKTAKDIAVTMVDKAEDVLARDVGVSALSTIQEPKVPKAPVSPNPVKNAVMGGFIGAFITIAIIIVVRFIKNKIYTAEDAQRALGLTVLASIPDIEDNTTVSAGLDSKDESDTKATQ